MLLLEARIHCFRCREAKSCMPIWCSVWELRICTELAALRLHCNGSNCALALGKKSVLIPAWDGSSGVWQHQLYTLRKQTTSWKISSCTQNWYSHTVICHNEFSARFKSDTARSSSAWKSAALLTVLVLYKCTQLRMGPGGSYCRANQPVLHWASTMCWSWAE